MVDLKGVPHVHRVAFLGKGEFNIVSQIIPKRCFGEQLFQIKLLNVRKGSGHVLE